MNVPLIMFKLSDSNLLQHIVLPFSVKYESKWGLTMEIFSCKAQGLGI